MSRFRKKLQLEAPKSSENPPTSFADLGAIFESIQDKEDEAKPVSSESRKDNAAKRFLSSLYRHLEQPKIIEARSSHRVPGLHASQLASQCPRSEILTEIALLMSGTTLEKKAEVHKAGSTMTQDMGHMIHDWWQNEYVGDAGLLFGTWKCVSCDHKMEGCKPKTCEKCGRKEVRYQEPKIYIGNGIELHGHTDGIILDTPWDLSSKRRILEIKTKRMKAFTEIKSPALKHVVQVHCYMKGLGLDEAILVYINKDLQCSWRKEDGVFVPGPPKVKAYLVKFDQDLWDSLETLALEFHEADKRITEVRAGTADPKVVLDPRDFTRICDTKTCNRARYCPVVDLCFDV